jgi:dTDP-4-amino-4,6-dideoxygalactose transaminase
MRELMDFAAAHDVAAIEDAAQCPGAIVQGRRAGTWGDVGVLSFGGSKLLTAGRGGAILTRRADVYQRAKVAQMRGNVVCPLSELQAAVLLPQLDKLDARNRRRGEAVRYLTDRLTGLPGLRPFVNTVADSQPSYYKVGFQYDETAFGLPRSRLTAALRAEGIAFDEGFRGLHVGRSPERFRAVGDLTEATRAHHGTLILHHPVLSGSDADLDIIVEVLHRLHANE